MIPIFEPIIGKEEIDAVISALRNGEISGTFGQNIPRFEQAFAEYCGCKYGIAVNSGTSALHLAVAAAGIGPGDEVVSPNPAYPIHHSRTRGCRGGHLESQFRSS